MPTPSLFVHSRQKSCIQCARAKRRCQPQAPRCSRCISRGLKCAYKNEPLLNQTPSWPAATSDLSAATDTTDLDPDFGIYDTNGILVDVRSLLVPADFSLSKEVNEGLSLKDYPLTQFPSLPLYPYPETAKIDKWSTSQILGEIKQFPATFASTQGTLFMHPRLYETLVPEPIQDAFIVCAAYTSRTSHTHDMILRILESKATSLAQRDNLTWSIQEQVAGVQALLLFQIIQLFDGDIRQRSVAESHEDILQAWTMRLNLISTGEIQSTDWRSWVFAETIRRTVIVSVIVHDVYSMLKRGYCANVPMLSVLCFTSNTELWDATSESTWLANTRLGGVRTIMYGKFSQAWAYGNVTGRIERFQKLLLIPCLGERYKEALEL